MRVVAQGCGLSRRDAGCRAGMRVVAQGCGLLRSLKAPGFMGELNSSHHVVLRTPTHRAVKLLDEWGTVLFRLMVQPYFDLWALAQFRSWAQTYFHARLQGQSLW